MTAPAAIVTASPLAISSATAPIASPSAVTMSEIADPPDRGDLPYPLAQRRRDRRPGVEEIDIAAARPRVPRRRYLSDLATVTPGPADPPFFHLADAVGRLLAQQGSEVLVTQTAPGGQSVVEMRVPIIGAFLTERRRHGHLRHHGGAPTPDKALVYQQHTIGAGARRSDGGVHAGAAGADDQEVGFEMGHRGPSGIAAPT
jgi:hypothetical protein